MLSDNDDSLDAAAIGCGCLVVVIASWLLFLVLASVFLISFLVTRSALGG